MMLNRYGLVMKKTSIFCISFLLFIYSAAAQVADRSNFVRDSLDIYMNRALTNWRIPGAAVCVVKDGKVVLMKTYGVKELGLPAHVDENTLFMIGGNTQPFTATILATLQEKKQLSLDDKVSKYLPNFRLQNKAASDMAVIRDLLSHHLGFQSLQGNFTFYNSTLSNSEVIEKMGHIVEAYPFRTRWGFTNAAYLAAGEIIPKAAGKSWSAYIRDNIFAPLGMTNTLAFTADMPQSLNRTAAHTLVDGRLVAIPYAQLDNLAPSLSICSSINDMSKWVLALLNDGKVGSRVVIPANALASTFEAQDIVKSVKLLNGESGDELYGLGWYIQNYAGRRIFMSDGAVNGYTSSVTLVLQDHLGIVVLTNTDQNNLQEALRWEVMDAYLKQPYHNYSEAYLRQYHINQNNEQLADKKLRDSAALKLPTAQPLNAYTGRYVNEVYGTLNISIGGDLGQLQLHFEHHPRMFATAQPIGGNRFYVVFSDPEFGKGVLPFTFTNGRLSGVRVKVSDFVESTAYDFKKM